MKTIIQDDRTPEQKSTHRFAVAATDRFLSGWGGARGGISSCAWACGPDVNINRVFNWVKSRSDMRRVRVVSLDKYRPGKGVAHFHIYVADKDNE